ncbi:hypothetical protein X910_06665 [Campylobacter jejuni subsp. jejuni 81-176-UMCW9]|nr:hypothetical protein X910_06665 [Campylobacter jejuni subsp. jejuni 81-176-UMCW9]
MYNPNSAIERVKNHLAYKLGQAMIEFTNNGGGYIALFKKLYKIKKQHKKNKNLSTNYTNLSSAQISKFRNMW